MFKFIPLLAGLATMQAQANVVITEYVEGGSFNKAIEISNLGTENVKLNEQGYKLALYTNGSATVTQDIALSGTLVPQSSIVIYHNSASDEFKKDAPQGIESSSVANFNGDDAVVLTNAQGVVDSFGQVGVREQWSNDSGFKSKDKTLRRLVTVTEGDVIADDDFTSQMAQWAVFDKDTADGLGCLGEAACTGNEPLPLEESDNAEPGVVIISEYIEGSGTNKVIEISNVGGSNVDLVTEGYKLELYSNGSETVTGDALLQGLLVPGSSIVVYNNGATAEFKKDAPQGFEASSAVNFNGDDAIVLSNSQGVVDSFGQVGVRQNWTNDAGFSSKNKTLRRLDTVLTGDTVSNDDFTSQMSQWVAFDINTSDGLGCTGEAVCTGNEPQPETGTELGGGDGGGDDDEICTNCPPLDKVKDRNNYDASVYYANTLAADNTDKTAFKAAITQDISEFHKNLAYNEVWTSLTYTDQDPANEANVILIYSGRSIPKAENGSGSASTNQDYWNREHVWAKSHGFPSTSQLGYTDIHHLRPADVSMNTQRSDNDFGNGGTPVAEAPENLKDGSVSWEPRNAVKGDVARMVFYMDTRYEAGNESTMPDLIVVDKAETDRTGLDDGTGELGKLCTLLEWHDNDPIDTFEIDRNNSIYEYQGNRNPYIDNPEWVDVVYRDMCETADPLAVTVAGAQDTEELQSITLTASANLADVTYSWEQQSGPTIALENASAASITFTAPEVDADTAASFSVTVVKGEETVTETVSFNILNKVEDVVLTVTVEGAQDTEESQSITLTAAANLADVTYSWEQQSGPTIELDDATAASITFTAPQVDADTAVSFSVTVVKGDQAVVETINFNVINKEEEQEEPEQPEESSSGSLFFLLISLFGLTAFRRIQK